MTRETSKDTPSQHLLKHIMSRLRPEEIIALAAIVLLGSLSYVFRRTINPTPYIFVMFVMFTPTFIIPLFVLGFKSVNQTVRAVFNLFRDWVPVVICMVAYENLHDMVHLLNANDYDQILLAIDRFLFGVQPTIYLERFIAPVVTEYFYFAYMTYFFYPVISLGVLYYQGRERPFRDLTVAMVLTLYLGFLGYVLVPAIGPQYTLAEQYSIDLQGYGMSQLQQKIDELFKIPRDCFPSLHFSLTTVIFLLTWRHNKWLAVIYSPLVLSLWISTVYLRYHYVVDLLAGIPLVLSVIIIAPRINSWWYSWADKSEIAVAGQ